MSLHWIGNVFSWRYSIYLGEAFIALATVEISLLELTPTFGIFIYNIVSLFRYSDLSYIYSVNIERIVVPCGYLLQGHCARTVASIIKFTVGSKPKKTA
jgi:hypothetical protein